MENTIKLSVYTTLYKVVENSFDYVTPLENFLAFADEVVVAVPIEGSEDGTLERLWDYKAKYDLAERLKIITCPIPFSDNRFDGKLKDAALQATTHPIKIQMDGDEIFVLSQKQKWVSYAKKLLESPYEALFIPTVDLWGDINHIRKNRLLGLKWRMHKGGLYRGVVKFAELSDGRIDTSKSDTCELIDKEGNLVPTVQIINPDYLRPENCKYLNNYIYTLHLGYLNFNYRLKINQFWKPHWENRAGRTIDDIVLEKCELLAEETVEHKLILI